MFVGKLFIQWPVLNKHNIKEKFVVKLMFDGRAQIALNLEHVVIMALNLKCCL